MPAVIVHTLSDLACAQSYTHTLTPTWASKKHTVPAVFSYTHCLSVSLHQTHKHNPHTNKHTANTTNNHTHNAHTNQLRRVRASVRTACLSLLASNAHNHNTAHLHTPLNNTLISCVACAPACELRVCLCSRRTRQRRRGPVPRLRLHCSAVATTAPRL
jgi:hypothetical protein